MGRRSNLQTTNGDDYVYCLQFAVWRLLRRGPRTKALPLLAMTAMKTVDSLTGQETVDSLTGQETVDSLTGQETLASFTGMETLTLPTGREDRIAVWRLLRRDQRTKAFPTSSGQASQ